MQLHDRVGLFELTDLIYLILGDEASSYLQGELPINEASNCQKAAWLLERYLDDVLMEIDGRSISPPTNDYFRESDKKSGQLSKDNCPDFCCKVSKQPIIL
jgi:hypothetical protein